MLKDFKLLLLSPCLAGGIFIVGFAFAQPPDPPGPVEIYSDGKKYNSVDEYKKSSLERVSTQEKKSLLGSSAPQLKAMEEFLGYFLLSLPGSSGLPLPENDIAKMLQSLLKGQPNNSSLPESHPDLGYFKEILNQTPKAGKAAPSPDAHPTE